MAKRELTEEQKQVRRDNLARGRAAKASKAAAPHEEPVEQHEPDEPQPLELSVEERARIREEAKKKVDAELAASNRAAKKELMAAELDKETLRLRKEAGLADWRDELVDILIDVAPFDDKITIDGKVFQHGTWHRVTARQRDTLNEIMARSWDSEERAGNPNRKFRREVAGTMNPMAHERRMPDGTLTVGRDTGVNATTGASWNLPNVGA